MDDRWERVDFADRWMRDGMAVAGRPGAVAVFEIDLSRARLALAALPAGAKISYVHLFVRAAAVALAAHPDLHQIVAGSRRCRPGRVDIGLSVAGDGAMAPVLVVHGADTKTVSEIADDVRARAPEVRDQDRRITALLRRWGWLLPFGFLRRGVIRWLLTHVGFRRRGVGAVQVTYVSGVDIPLPMAFTATAIVGFGAVRERVLAVNGRPEARMTTWASCAFDHAAWDGQRAATYIRAIKRALESGELLAGELTPSRPPASA